MNNANYAALIFMVFLSGCASTQLPAVQAVPVKLDSVQRAEIETGLRKGFKDPDSVKFGFMNAARADNGLIAVCGWLNAKNSFGGYVGETEFYGSYVPDQHATVLIASGENDSTGTLVESQCVRNGTTTRRTAISSFPTN